MKKFVYFCMLTTICLNAMAQIKNAYDSNDTICSYIEKHLSFQYDTTLAPMASGWIYDNYYSDEFNGSQLDISKWKCWNNFYHINNNAVGYLAENVSVSNGKLILSAKYSEQAHNFTYHNHSSIISHFSSGAIESLQKIRYGYYEAECYLPKNHHFRPCFWTVGGDIDYDEIDVFEIIPDDNSPYKFQQNEYSNIHTDDISKSRQRIVLSDSLTGKTIRFGVEVLPYEIVFYINGHVSSQLVYNYDYANDYNIFTCSDITRTVPMKIIFSFIITLENNAIPQPYEDFTIDYFRCYKLSRGSIDTYNPTTFSPTATSSKVYPHVILGGIGHTATITASTAIWAEQTIILDKGFELYPDNSFSARVINHGSENPAVSPLYIEFSN